MKVLLSIKPEFANKILKREKLYEFRKSIFRKYNIKTVVIYSTSPICRIVGEFDIEDILYDAPDVLWDETKEYAGISKTFFDKYFSGRSGGYAIKIGETRRYEKPINPFKGASEFTPPQSFAYVQ